MFTVTHDDDWINIAEYAAGPVFTIHMDSPDNNSATTFTWEISDGDGHSSTGGPAAIQGSSTTFTADVSGFTDATRASVVVAVLDVALNPSTANASAMIGGLFSSCPLQRVVG